MSSEDRTIGGEVRILSIAGEPENKKNMRMEIYHFRPSKVLLGKFWETNGKLKFQSRDDSTAV
jgi:hypothetical protein